MKPSLTLAAAIAIMLVAAPVAVAKKGSRDCDERCDPVPMTDSDRSRESQSEEVSQPRVQNRLLETTLVLDAVAAFADRAPEFKEGPSELGRGDDASSAGTVLVVPRGGGMMTARQRAEHKIRIVIRRLH
jgi:hypothetical protein